jgi:hypothetical protein
VSLDTSPRCQYVIVTYCHLSLPTVNLLKSLGYGSHCREGINGNPVLTLDYFSLLERLAQSLVRCFASFFDYAQVPSLGRYRPPPWVTLPLTAYSLVAAVGARLPSWVFVVLHWSPPPGIRTLDTGPGAVIPFRKVAVPRCEGSQITLFPVSLSLHIFHPHPTLKLPQDVLSSKHPSQGSATRPVFEG